MKRILALAIVFIIPFILSASDTETMKKELKSLEGTWKAVAMEAGGAPFPTESIPPFIFIVSADGKSISKSSFGNYQGTIVVEPTKSPKTIDNLHETGAQKGEKQYGIYKLHGDKWTVCMTPPGAAESDRPKNFKTKGTISVLFVFERQEENEK